MTKKTCTVNRSGHWVQLMAVDNDVDHVTLCHVLQLVEGSEDNIINLKENNDALPWRALSTFRADNGKICINRYSFRVPYHALS